MRAVDLIRRKRDGGMLGAADIESFIGGVTTGTWEDYQIAAMLMAIVLRGMSVDEVSALTSAMVDSGMRLDLSEFRHVADKHSTGGVGDKLSLVVAPLAAACGVVVPMMSGRALGHTGGTLDKLESIPGFRTRLSLAEMRDVLADTGCVLIGQTDNIAPADRRLYALRDVTATVESLPLITASILSKKIAEGIGALVLDVKVGRGAFLKDEHETRALATLLVDIADQHGIHTEAVLTAMDAPLGRTVGNANEVAEAVDTLRGRGPADVEHLSVMLAANMMRLSGLAPSDEVAETRVRDALATGAGLEKFRAIVAAQGGDVAVLDRPDRLPAATTRVDWIAPRSGFVAALDADMLGRAAGALGAGRNRVEETVDHAAGIDILVTCGEEVRAGDPVLTLVTNDASRVAHARALADRGVTIDDAPPTLQPLVIDRITAVAAH